MLGDGFRGHSCALGSSTNHRETGGHGRGAKKGEAEWAKMMKSSQKIQKRKYHEWRGALGPTLSAEEKESNRQKPQIQCLDAQDSQTAPPQLHHSHTNLASQEKIHG